MRILTIVALVCCLSLGLAACGEDASEATPEAPAGDFVTVAEDGTRFEPAVQKSEIPPGAWICDMGTVHFASLEQGDGSCDVCGMNLVQHAH